MTESREVVSFATTTDHPDQPVVSLDRRCSAVTNAGKACRTRPLAGTEPPLCRLHLAQVDPALKERVDAERRLGGYNATMRTLAQVERPNFGDRDGVRRALEDVAQGVLRGEIAPSIANSFANLANVALRLAELEIDTKIAALELDLKRQRRGDIVVVDSDAGDRTEAA
jgi:hypothetical protein